MGEEIRRRLEYTFAVAGTPIDEITDEVIAEIRDIATDLSRYGPLYADSFVFGVFKAAVNALLSNHQPPSEQPEIRSRFRAVYGDKPAADIGLIIAQAAIFAYGRERRGGLTGPTGLTGPAMRPGDVKSQLRSKGSGPTGPSGPSRSARSTE
jgi:hypothetical protein